MISATVKTFKTYVWVTWHQVSHLIRSTIGLSNPVIWKI